MIDKLRKNRKTHVLILILIVIDQMIKLIVKDYHGVKIPIVIKNRKNLNKLSNRELIIDYFSFIKGCISSRV